MLPEAMPLDQATCQMVVIRYLLGQGWRLADPAVLAAEVWQALAGQALTGAAAVKAVNNQVWQGYAAVLHDACRQEVATAWEELHRWLQQQARPFHPDDQEQLVQETILNLQSRLRVDRTNAPRAFFGYALTALQNRQKDLYRRRTAARRRQGRELPVVELEVNEPAQDLLAWEEVTAGGSGRETEESVMNRQAQGQLRAFFEVYVTSPLQRQVAALHYLEDLNPAEIAPLLGKRPHEIRLIKARLVQSLRDLPPAAQQELQAILGGFESYPPGGL
jgi:RNA polymerase sigma factor (sigma-70 family)